MVRAGAVTGRRLRSTRFGRSPRPRAVRPWWSRLARTSQPLPCRPGVETFLRRAAQPDDRALEELYRESENPTLSDSDLHGALVFLRNLAHESPNGGSVLDDTALNTVWSLGSAGYCWRFAEEQVHGRPHQEYLDEFDAMWRSLPDDPPRREVSRERLLFWGACESANRVQANKLRPWSGSPGGFAVQFDYFEDGFANVCEGVVRDDVEVSRPDLWYAWCFGFGLRDSERWLDEHPVA